MTYQNNYQIYLKKNMFQTIANLREITEIFMTSSKCLECLLWCCYILSSVSPSHQFNHNANYPFLEFSNDSLVPCNPCPVDLSNLTLHYSNNELNFQLLRIKKLQSTTSYTCLYFYCKQKLHFKVIFNHQSFCCVT